MNYFKSVLVGLSTFAAGLFLLKANSLLLQHMQAHIDNPPTRSDPAEVSWSIRLDPHFTYVLLAIVATVAAIWTYRRLERRNRSSR